MTTPVQEKRPTGEAARHYADALRLEREAGDAVIHKCNLEEAERLRGLAKEAWRRFREACR